MLPLLVSVFATLPVFKPPDSFEPEWLVPADTSFTGGANYVAINKVTGKRYEGESVKFHKRHNNHKNDPFNAKLKEKQKKFYNSIRKHGFEKFDFYFRHKFIFVGLEKLNREEKKAFYAAFKAAYLHPCETYWIRRHNLIKDGYNLKESGEGGAGHVFTDEQKARMSASQPKKPVTRCKILQDGETHQKVRLTRYDGCHAAERANPGAGSENISRCCLKNRKSTGGYLWWHCKDTDVYDKDIMVKWVGEVPGLEQAVISKLKLPNGYLEQWHDSMGEGGRTLSTADKTVYQTAISMCCLGKRKSHQGYQFRRVTTEKKEDFPDGKRIVNTKKRKRS
jgi:group I intron endonuclease